VPVAQTAAPRTVAPRPSPTLATGATTAKAACDDIAVDPNLDVSHNQPLDEQGYAATLARVSTDRQTVRDAKALVSAIGTYLADERAGTSLPDYTAQEGAVDDDCTRDFPNG
jgi:hypothetical protein